MNSSQKPVARREGLVVQEMPDEVLVFDTETNKAHCLNETAAFVWKACDGNRSVAEITKLFGDESGKPVDENLVWLAIDQLNESKLLAEELKPNFGGQSRREVIKKMGLAAVVALPIVASLVAPTAALAVTCTSPVTSCSPCDNAAPCSVPGQGANGCTPAAGNNNGGMCAGGGSAICVCTTA